MVVIYVEGPRGGRLPLREENMIVDYVDTACQELKIKDADIDVHLLIYYSCNKGVICQIIQIQ